TVIIFLIVLAVLIFVHELGHFLLARTCGIRVDAFALGFGPKLISWKRGETLYSLNLIPFGGYVKIFGENPDSDSISGPDSKRSFVNKPRWKQAIVFVAGISFNFLFAALLYIIVFTHGVTATSDGFEKYADRFTNPRIMITEVMPGSPADKAGIKMGDVISEVSIKEGSIKIVDLTTALNSSSAGTIKAADSNVQTGGTIKTADLPTKPVGNDSQTVEDIQSAINSSKGNPINIQLLVNSKPQAVEVTPIQGLVNDKYAIGIAMNEVVDMRLPFFTSIYEGAHYTVFMIKETAVGLYYFFGSLFQGTAKLSEVAGPVGIAGIVGNAASLGFTYLLMITALISINLGVINLAPFPALDGGRVLFVAIEGIIRRRISPTFLNIVNTVGFVLLMILMVLVTYQDIVKLFR
ncbi:MAG: site-2 protease family protein, partial [Candidatus Taylorbacteria bacterium]|nr:site-2 protease family protein [Candidatus Taylorbacteria bacterium]